MTMCTSSQRAFLRSPNGLNNTSLWFGDEVRKIQGEKSGMELPVYLSGSAILEFV